MHQQNHQHMYRSLITFAVVCLAFSPACAQKFLNKKAPEISLSALRDGRQTAYSLPAGKFLLLEFWATWCTPCVRNIPHFNKLAREFEGKIEFISISDEATDKVARFVAAHSLSGVVAVDNSGKAFKAFNVKGRPSTFIINDNGVVVYEGDPYMLTSEMLTALLNGEQLTGDNSGAQAGKLGGWGGGEDPVVTGNFDMKKMHYRRYEVIRRSVSSGGGSGWKNWNGEAGITLLSVTRKDIIAFTNDLPSPHRVIDHLPDSSTTWDVIFYRKTGYDLATAKKDVENMTSETLAFRVAHESREAKVWRPSYDASKLINATRVPDNDPNLKSYELLSEVCATVEQRTGKIIECPPAADELYVDVFELGSRYYAMSGDELTAWLQNKPGITFSPSRGSVNFLVLSAKEPR